MVCNAFRSINGAPVKVLTAKVREGSLGTQRTGPFHTEDRRRAPALRFGDPRVQALAGALCTTALAVTGITNRSLRALMTGLLGAATYSVNQASYDLARLRTNGLITRIPGKNRYRPASIPPIQQRPGRLPRGSGPARRGLRVPVHICGRRPQRAGPPRRRPRLR